MGSARSRKALSSEAKKSFPPGSESAARLGAMLEKRKAA